jgi:UDP-N-acetylmuramoyl-L-alanyl-D-glutamate--2,6-diaminopimelate ligase
MKQLKDILYKVRIENVSGTTDIPISSIAFDSRKVENDSLFVAVKGSNSDGHDFISQAVISGAVAVVCQNMPVIQNENVTYILVKDSSLALGIAASNFYENPSSKLKLTGITGTNGKTTTATLLQELFMALGHSCGLLSTVCNKINNEIIPSTHTTPDAIELNRLLNEMVQSGCTHCFMEVSSHAVVQNRIGGLEFAGGVFTNITHDHLDYHKTFDEYIKAKKGFFDNLGKHAFALINTDDKNGKIMLQNTKATPYTFGLMNIADFKAKIIENRFSGLQLNIDGLEVWFKLVGNFNAYNLLGIYVTAVLLGEDKIQVLTLLSNIGAVEGRFDMIKSPDGKIAIVDYAHTPDALQNVLSTINSVAETGEEIITVVGCGGDRDHAKRPVMAKIACDLSSRVIITSDNPRSEDPEKIIEEMMAGVDFSVKSKVLAIVNRREAIKTATALAKPGDIILLAGKGHEKYQEIKGVKNPFDDKQIITEIFEQNI